EAGYDPAAIVFDSPCKTREEIEFALLNDIHINADSLNELERIDSLIKKTASKSSIGVRINPQVGNGLIKSTSVADLISKFGVPLEPNREKLMACFRMYPWLTGVHLHIGSQGMPIPLLTMGVKKVMEFTQEVNRLLEGPGNQKRISIFDIGGGLPVSYRFDQSPVSMKEYRAALEKEVPELFSGDFRIITEFGRYIHTNAGWAASRVEYVKKEADYNILMTHLGADFMLRECYNPQDWHHEITVLDSEGNLKDPVKTQKYFIAGPLCFAGDIIGHDIELPAVNEGDYIVIHDVGAYTLSMWSRYNSRQTPLVIGYSEEDETFEVLKNRENVNQVIGFWK
ncbi:MAG: diaminopimelate decarboxylase, partial [Bacteroidales bacterium]|nr:diaminopimelate decarboxylase [Bacteroidales bacterium]